MRLRRRSRESLTVGKGRATPERAREEFDAAVAGANERTRASGLPPRKVQLLGQACSGKDYEKVRTYWLPRAPEDVAKWPASLPGDQFALYLWPLGPGGGRASKLGRLKLITVPGFGTFQRTYTFETAFYVVAAIWLNTTASRHLPAIKLLDPVVEVWTGGRRIERCSLPLPRT